MRSKGRSAVRTLQIKSSARRRHSEAAPTSDTKAVADLLAAYTKMVGKEAAIAALRDGLSLEQAGTRRIAELRAENTRLQAESVRLRARLRSAEVDAESTGATADRAPKLSESARRKLGPNLAKVAGAMRLPGRGAGASPAQSGQRPTNQRPQGRRLSPGLAKIADAMRLPGRARSNRAEPTARRRSGRK